MTSGRADVPTPVQNAECDLNLPLRARCAFGGDLDAKNSFLRRRKPSEKCQLSNCSSRSNAKSLWLLIALRLVSIGIRIRDKVSLLHLCVDAPGYTK